MMDVIEVNNVWKKFRKGEKINSLRERIPALLKNSFKKRNTNQLAKEEFWALKDLSFKMSKGDVLGIIGPNGAGKSTLLNVLAGIMPPTKGEYKYSGRLSAIIEVSTGFHPDFTGRENVFFSGAILGMKRKEIAEKFDAILNFSGIKDFIDTPVKYYSTGMEARLGFAIAAHVDPNILLVDEVLSVGDIAFQAKCLRKMKELQSKGVTIIFISHNITLVGHLCKRVLLLDEGKVLKDGLPKDVIPFYEDLMEEREVDELREELENEDEEGLGSRAQYPAEILDISFNNKKKTDKDVFFSDEPISIKFAYDIQKEIKNPIFVLEIVRMDGVVCCDTNTKEENISFSKISGNGFISINLDPMHLIPDTYYARISVLDENFLHPFAMTKKKIFKIDTDEKDSAFESIFFAKAKWVV